MKTLILNIEPEMHNAIIRLCKVRMTNKSSTVRYLIAKGLEQMRE